ncbi:MAG: N-acetylglucosaminyl-diphospho-decaprenol L-rhamnosyltransferase [Acidimicrobiaceae bacterium]|nr:N-acetylglucosaminyl-diphospho-decaprenol L-rhamnosyltransferase [Acidimicrobiaceae bacterium]
MINVVCILHGNVAPPPWLIEAPTLGNVYITINDPGAGRYEVLPDGAIVTVNNVPLGFAENINAALRKVFIDDGQEEACVVNFDLEMRSDALVKLASALRSEPASGVVGAVLVGPDGSPTFSVGTLPTPLKEFLRAAGLRSGALFRLQRRTLRRSQRWVARNAPPAKGSRILSAEEYLPWSCVAVSRRAWEGVGPMDERFPLYAEDIDWSIRCRQAGWLPSLHDCGRVTHHERATRGRRADTLYEFSHLELHRKWGWTANLRWQTRGLRARRSWPLRSLAAPLDWSLLTKLDRS